MPTGSRSWVSFNFKRKNEMSAFVIHCLFFSFDEDDRVGQESASKRAAGDAQL